MKRILAIIFSIAMLISMAACSSKGESPSSDDSKSTTQAEKITAGTSDTAEVKDSGEVGSATVAIKSAKFIKDSDSGEDVVILTFEYTNNADDDRSFNSELMTAVSQDDQLLSGAPLISDPDFLYEDNLNKASKKGETIQVQQAYKLKNTDSDVLVQIKELIYVSDKPDMVEKTFDIVK